MTRYRLTLHYSKYVDVYVEARDREHARDLADTFYAQVSLSPVVDVPLPPAFLAFEGDEEDLESVLVGDPDEGVVIAAGYGSCGG